MAGPAWEEETDGDRAVLRLVERGHDEGTIDRELEPRWVRQLLWSVLFSGWSHVRENEVPKHDALSLCLRSLEKALAP